MHIWGDENFDWDSLDNAGLFIHSYCVKYARLGGQWKEKYGTLRFYAQFGLSLHSLYAPDYHFIQFPSFVHIFDLYVFTPLMNKLGVNLLWQMWQSRVYCKAYRTALKRWPHIAKEIACGADYPELFAYDVIVTKIDGQVQKDYLNSDGTILVTWTECGET